MEDRGRPWKNVENRGLTLGGLLVVDLLISDGSGSWIMKVIYTEGFLCLLASRDGKGQMLAIS